MGQAHKCPNCEGSGQRVNERTRQMDTCHSCNGSGVVFEPDRSDEAETVVPDDALELRGL